MKKIYFIQLDRRKNIFKNKEKRGCMTLGLLGNKIGMTQIFDKTGNIIPVTIIKGGPCYITQIKSEENSGYKAIQLGYLEILKRRILTKPELGHFNKISLPPFRYLKEFRTDEKIYQIGQELTVNMFQVGEMIHISGLTTGKGNTGNIKEHNFSRGPMAHGSKHHRLQGSLGAGTTPGRVFPGKAGNLVTIYKV